MTTPPTTPAIEAAKRYATIDHRRHAVSAEDRNLIWEYVPDEDKGAGSALSYGVNRILAAALEAKQSDPIKDLNRRVDVQNVLLSVAAGKRGPLTKRECRELAYKLGVPDKYQTDQ